MRQQCQSVPRQDFVPNVTKKSNYDQSKGSGLNRDGPIRFVMIH